MKDFEKGVYIAMAGVFVILLALAINRDRIYGIGKYAPEKETVWVEEMETASQTVPETTEPETTEKTTFSVEQVESIYAEALRREAEEKRKAEEKRAIEETAQISDISMPEAETEKKDTKTAVVEVETTTSPLIIPEEKPTEQTNGGDKIILPEQTVASNTNMSWEEFWAEADANPGETCGPAEKSNIGELTGIKVGY